MAGSKIVNYPIIVPEGDYCWDGNRACQFFDNEGGHAHCELNFYGQTYDKQGYGVIKSDKCKKLKEAK